MKKYWTYLGIAFSNSFEYRGALFIWTLVEVVGLCSSLFIWSGIFRTQSQVGDYQLSGIITYYFLLPVIGAITTVFVSDTLPRDIKDGQISSQIIKPYNFSLLKLTDTLATKLTRIILKFPIYLIIGIFLWPVISQTLKLEMLLLTLVISLSAYILHFFLDYCLSLLAFWIEDTWSFSLLKRVTLLIFGGLAFPISMVPDTYRWLFNFLPFKFIYYIPVSIIQGKLTLWDIGFNLFQLIIWTLLFLLTSRLLWSRGMKKYGAYGQ